MLGYALAEEFSTASVIGSASRAGSVLCTAELLAMVAIDWCDCGIRKPACRTRSTTACCWRFLSWRQHSLLPWDGSASGNVFQQNDPYLVRREFIVAAADMAKQRPLTATAWDIPGGLPSDMQSRIFRFNANHATTTGEFAADGGSSVSAAGFDPICRRCSRSRSESLGAGLIAIMLHACGGLPFSAPSGLGWIFAMLRTSLLARMPEGRSQPRVNSTIPKDAAPRMSLPSTM